MGVFIKNQLVIIHQIIQKDIAHPFFMLLAGSLSARAALDPAQVNQLVAEDSSDKVAAIQQLTQTADPDAVRVLKAMAEGADLSSLRATISAAAAGFADTHSAAISVASLVASGNLEAKDAVTRSMMFAFLYCGCSSM